MLAKRQGTAAASAYAADLKTTLKVWWATLLEPRDRRQAPPNPIASACEQSATSD